MIEQKKISQISNKTQQAGGKKVPEPIIERDYCLSWFLLRRAFEITSITTASEGRVI